jgi:hypothetical protein
MNATTRPPRRRKSALAEEHPAWNPSGIPDIPPPVVEQEPLKERRPAEDLEPSRAVSLRRVRETALAHDKRAKEARARTFVRNAAWGWAAATRKAAERLDTWVADTRRARELGTAPGLLREFICEAAERAGLDETAIPREVWEAANLDGP